MGWRRVAAWGIAVALLAASTPLAAAGFAYGVNGEDFSLSSYQIEADGSLRHLGHMPIHKAPSMVVSDPSGRFVVAVSSTHDTLMVFRRDPLSGELIAVPGSPFATGARSPFSISFHPSGRFVYLGGRFSGVSALSFDPQTGAVKPLPGSPFPAQNRTRKVKVHPSGKYLYASNAYSNSVSAFLIDQQSGALSRLPGSPYSVGEFGKIDYLGLGMADVPPEAGGLPHDLELDPEGRFVFVANKAGASVSVFAIDADSGELSMVPGSPFFIGFNPYRLAVHPSGRFLYVTLWVSGELSILRIDPDSGRLTPIKGSPFPLDSASPVAINFNADGSQVYVSNYDGNEIILLDVDQDSGAVQRRSSLMTRLGPWWLTLVDGGGAVKTPRLFAALGEAGVGRLANGAVAGASRALGAATAIAVAPNSRHAYALNRKDGTLAGFAIDPASGDLRPLPGGVVSAGPGASDLAIDVNGWYLYTANADGDSMSVFFLEPETGLPKPVRGSPRQTGRQPVAITLDPAARYAFVANAGSNDVSVYRYVNNVSPLIFEVRKYGSPFAAGKQPRDIVVEPTGHFAYTANAGSNDITAFTIQRKTGALSALPGSPFKAGARPVSLAAHPNGRLLFVANAGSRAVGIYGIEAVLGALRQQGSLSLPVTPKALWLNPTGDRLYVLAADGHRLLGYTVDAGTGRLSPATDRRLSREVTALAPVALPAR